jgi:hypothetical protein
VNVEVKPRIESFSLPAPAPANDNAERNPEYAQPRRRMIIYKPSKSAMMLGRRRTKRWLLEFEPQSAPLIEPLTGWTGSTDPLAQTRLSFSTRQAAMAYAERQRLGYEVREPRSSAEVLRADAQPQRDPMPFWPIELLNPLMLLPEVEQTVFASGIAA